MKSLLHCLMLTLMLRVWFHVPGTWTTNGDGGFDASGIMLGETHIYSGDTHMLVRFDDGQLADILLPWVTGSKWVEVKK